MNLKLRYCFVILFAISLLVYGNTFFNQWTYDDVPVVVENPDSQSIAGFINNTRPGRPMRELTYILDHTLFEKKPAGYHIQQILWHVINASLLCALFLKLRIRPLYAVLASVLFLIHPLQSETLANISHRKELLALFFVLASVHLHIKSISQSGLRLYLYIILSMFSFAGAIFSNQTAITAPFILILYEILFLKNEERIITRKPLLLCSSLVLALAYFLYSYRSLFGSEALLSVYSKNSFIASKSFIPLWMADLKAFIFYLYKIVVPVNLAPEYTFKFSDAFFQPLSLCSAVILCFLAYQAVTNRRQSPTISFGIGWFFIFYLPVSNILPVAYIVADRYMYLTLPGVSLLVAFVLQKYDSRKVTAVTCAILLFFSLLCIIQNSYWRDEHTLWRHAVKVNPESTWVQETVALSYLISDDFIRARDHAKKAIALNRYNSRAYFTLAKAEDRLGNLEEAIKYFELFRSFGFMEYPEDASNVENYLPLLRERAAKQKILRNSN